MKKSKAFSTAILIGIASLVLGGCAPQEDTEPIVIGEFTQITALDPATVYGTTNFEVLYQIYPTLLNSGLGTPEIQPDIAETAEFTKPNVYSVRLKPGLKFANQNDLTASDVAFSINRQIGIADEFGPSILLYNLEKAVVKSELEVDFYLKSDNDQTFPYVLSSVPGLIVDEDVFAADRIMTNEEILAGKPYAGPYVIESFKLNEFISYLPNPTYKGLWGAPKNSGIIVKYYVDAKNLAFDAKSGKLDIAVTYRTLSGEEISSIAESSDLRIDTGDAAEPGYLVNNFKSMPYGESTKNPDEKKALAIRKAMATLIDREQISETAYSGTYLPAYSPIPKSIPGFDDSAMLEYKNLSTSERQLKAKEILKNAGITEKNTIEIIFPFDRYGPATENAATLIKTQIESGGLFEVNLSSVDWGSFREIRRTDEYQSLLLFWGPDFGDADNYITPLFKTGGFLFNHYSNSALDELIDVQRQQVDKAARLESLRKIQEYLADDLPVIPLLETGRSALVKKNISGVKETLDASHKFKYFNFKRN